MPDTGIQKEGETMKPVVVRNIKIGEGRPKICVPVVARDEVSILKDAREIRALPVDVVEWRADWYEDVTSIGKTMGMAAKLRQVLGDIPVLFTFRSAKEGGKMEISPEDYAALNCRVASGGQVDLVDVELSMGDSLVEDVIQKIHMEGLGVIVSSHDFEKTPPKEELVSRMEKMQRLGADIAKVAVMPRSGDDVLTLLSATLEMHEHHARVPLITMSMSSAGVLSRLSGEVFGSALTFGAASQASAPGQIGVRDLKTVLDIVHNSR